MAQTMPTETLFHGTKNSYCMRLPPAWDGMKNGGDDMRLIDADALEAKLEEQRKLYIEMDMKGAEHLRVHDVLHHVWEAPTIDAVPVVRCKECKHWLKGDGSCFPHADYNDFCSNGERRDDE